MVVPQRFGLADRMPDQAEQDLRPEPVQYPYQQGQYGDVASSVKALAPAGLSPVFCK